MARPFPCNWQLERQYCFLTPLEEQRRILPDLQASVILKSHDFTALPSVHRLADHLTARYGGFSGNWAFTPIREALVLRVPDWLPADDLLLDAEYWDRTHYIQILPWNGLSNSEPLPPITRVRITISDFPLDFCHPFYYRQATASMGCLTGVDRESLRGSHRSFVRVFLDCPDLRLIPLTLVVGHDGRWTECAVQLEIRKNPDPPL